MKCPSCNQTLEVPEADAGKPVTCPACGAMMTAADVIYDAQEIGAEEIPQTSGPAGELHAAAPQGPSAEQAADQDGGQRRPCPLCGEMIIATAAKCRFCGAILDETLKLEEEKKIAADANANLTTGDWIFCVLCAGIACIFGIVYAIQGKPKGMKMIGVSIVAAIVWNVISALIQMAARSGSHQGFH
jgi:predicted RNA-binding Zn-ribbon protein involved in translation (DUF1610 family)